MKAAVFYGPGDVRFEQVPDPVLEPNEVLIRVRACGICGSDLHTYRHGMFLQALGQPVGDGHILGHELSGEIVAIEGDAPGLAVGDRIATSGIGGNAEFLKMSAAMAPMLKPIPASLGFEEAATTEPLATSLHAVNLAAPTDEQAVVIMGAGIIGLGVLQAVKARCQARTLVVDMAKRRLGTAKAIGADEVIDLTTVDPVEEILSLTGALAGRGVAGARRGSVDSVFDCAGAGRHFTGRTALEMALQVARQDGQVVVVAAFERPVAVDFNVVMAKGLAVLGSWAWRPDEFADALALISEGKVDRRPLISHAFPLEQAAEAYETQLNADQAVKVLLVP